MATITFNTLQASRNLQMELRNSNLLKGEPAISFDQARAELRKRRRALGRR